MIAQNIQIILLIAGVLTGLTILQFLFPKFYVSVFNKVKTDGDQLRFYARQGGLAISSIAALLVWSAFDPALRYPVVTVALVGKLLFALTIFVNLKKMPGLLTTAIVDTIISIVLILYLAGL